MIPVLVHIGWEKECPDFVAREWTGRVITVVIVEAYYCV